MPQEFQISMKQTFHQSSYRGKLQCPKCCFLLLMPKNVFRGLSVIFPMIEKKDNGRTKFSGHKGNKNAKNVIRANGPRRSMCSSTSGIGRTKFHGLLNSLNVTRLYISFSFTVSYDLATLRSCFLFGSRMSL